MINVQPNSCELVPLSRSRLHEEKNCKINPWNDQSASVEKTSTYIWIEKMQLSLSDTCSNTLVNMLNILIHFITCSLYFALKTNACVTINFCFALKALRWLVVEILSIPVHEVLIPNKLNDS